MSRIWNWCAFCGKRIETGEKCYGLPNGESVCADCCVAENDGVFERIQQPNFNMRVFNHNFQKGMEAKEE